MATALPSFADRVIEVDVRLSEAPSAIRRICGNRGVGFESVALLSEAEAAACTDGVRLLWDRQAESGGFFSIPMLEDVDQRVSTVFPELAPPPPQQQLVVPGGPADGESGRRGGRGGAPGGAPGGDTLLVTHGDLAMLYSPTLPGVPDLGKYVFEESGFLMVKGPHGPRADDGAVVGKFRLHDF